MDQPYLLNLAGAVMPVRHYPRRTEEACVYWNRQGGAALSEVLLDSPAERD